MYKGESITAKHACEHIIKADFLLNSKGEKPTAEEIYNYSPTGELFKIYEWYTDACLFLGKTVLGQAFTPEDLKQHYKQIQKSLGHA